MEESALPQSVEYKILDLERQMQVKHLQIESLLEVTKAINNNLSAESLFKIYEFILMAQLGVNEFVLYLFKDDIWERKVIHGFDEANFKDVVFNAEVLSIKQNLVLRNQNSTLKNQFKIVVPVFHKERPLAYMFLGEINLFDNESLEEKIKFIQTITNVIVVAFENKRLFKDQLEGERLKKELELAANMQNLLIPETLPYNEKLKMAAFYKPHQNIGGDYYDCIALTANIELFCIADISGKGAAAAILMANFQAVLRTLVEEKNTLKDLVKALNKRVVEITKGEKFITLFVATYNTETRELIYINAGHNPSLLFQNNEVVHLEKGTTILGIFDDLNKIEAGKVTLEKGAKLINYTDGLTDTINDNEAFFDLEKLSFFLKNNASIKPKEFNNKLIEFVELFKGAQEYADDITILTLEVD